MKSIIVFLIAIVAVACMAEEFGTTGSSISVVLNGNPGKLNENNETVPIGPKQVAVLSSFKTMKEFLTQIGKEFDIVAAEAGSVYNGNGRQLKELSDLENQDTVYFLSEGELWMWPAEKVGQKYELGDVDEALNTTVTVPKLVARVVSTNPRVLLIDNFLSAEECDQMIEMAKPNMTVGDENEEPSAWLEQDNNDLLENLEVRFKHASRVEFSDDSSEDIQVGKLNSTMTYEHRYDASDEQYEDGYNRFASFVMFLNDVQGGETVFPYGNGNQFNGNYSDCNQGLKIRAKKGSALLVYNLQAGGVVDGTMDPSSLRGECKPNSGVKFVANKFIWNRADPYESEDDEYSDRSDDDEYSDHSDDDISASEDEGTDAEEGSESDVSEEEDVKGEQGKGEEKEEEKE